MKSVLRKLIPRPVLERYKQHKREQEQAQNRHRTVEDVFTGIYAQNLWGGAKGEFCSGNGTTDDNVVAPYIAMLQRKGRSESFLGRRFVDLGCGDFRVGRQLLPLCSSYVGVDVVQPLVARNQEQFGNATTRFVHLNIVDDPLPEGDVCLIRQVLQHLSNQQISAILPKFKAYRWVFITEHYPPDDAPVTPNKDKVHGSDVRVDDNSGVYLLEPPFSLPKQAVSTVLEVPGWGGMIRTFLYEPHRA